MRIDSTSWVLVLASITVLSGNVGAGDGNGVADVRNTSDRGMWLGSRPVQFETIDKGIIGPWTRPALILIRNPAEWSMAMLRAGAVIPIPPPRIDWTRKAVVLAVLGEQPVLGYRIEVSEAMRHAQDLLLKVHIQLPDSPNPTQNFSYPYHLVSVDTWKSMGLAAQYDAVVPDIDTYQPPPQHGKEKLDRSSGAKKDSREATWGDLKSLLH